MTTRTIYWGYTILHQEDGLFTVTDPRGKSIGDKPFINMTKARWAVDRHLEKQERLQNGTVAA